jgi:prepilin-type N-terminal cleavage/methylation domain-containing protein/prepilin-type processing-associated H-X9-DG protein
MGSKMTASQSAKNGFTLLELLVCIAIIAVLAAMLLPVLASAKSRSEAASCLNNVRQLSLACIVYTDDANDALPYNMGETEIRQAVASRKYVNWNSSVMSWELDSDNTNSALVVEGGIGPYTSGNAAVYRCPKDRVVSDIQAAAGWSQRVRTISMNAMVGNAGEFSKTGENSNNPTYRQFFRSTQVPKPSEIFVFIEEHPDSVNDGYFLNKWYSKQWLDLPASFHGDSANLSFVDGHAESRRWRFGSTRPPARPDAAKLPFRIPENELSDYEWLMARTSIHGQADDHDEYY